MVNLVAGGPGRLHRASVSSPALVPKSSSGSKYDITILVAGGSVRLHRALVCSLALVPKSPTGS